MRQIISFLLVGLLVAQLSPAALGAEDVASQITGMSVGTNIEVRLKDKRTLRGARGEVSGSGFTLVNPSGGDRRLAFDDVSSVKQWNKKSHTVRNVLIGAGIGLAVVTVVLAVLVSNARY